MDAISQDISSAGMAAAIEANWNATFSLVGRSPITHSHDDDPHMSWYVTPKVPFPLFNHVYSTSLSPEGIDVRIVEVLGRFAEHQAAFMWSVGPFTHPPDLAARLESHGLARADDLPGMAVDLQGLNEDIPFPSELAIERVSDTEVLGEF